MWRPERLNRLSVFSMFCPVIVASRIAARVLTGLGSAACRVGSVTMRTMRKSCANRPGKAAPVRRVWEARRGACAQCGMVMLRRVAHACRRNASLCADSSLRRYGERRCLNRSSVARGRTSRHARCYTVNRAGTQELFSTRMAAQHPELMLRGAIFSSMVV